MKHLAILSGLTLLSSAPGKADSLLAYGTGYPFGGVAGAQYQLVQPQHKWTAALALSGIALGWQYSLDAEQHHALGLSVGAEVVSAEDGFVTLDYLYYPSGFRNSGWFYGASAGAGRYRPGSNAFWRDTSPNCADKRWHLPCAGAKQQRLVMFFTLGYQF